MAVPSPTVAGWELATRLKERRLELGIGIKTITDKLGCPRTYWSAIENMNLVLTEDKFREIVALLGFEPEEEMELAALQEVSQEKGWWAKYATSLDETVVKLIGLEAGAKKIRTYEGLIVNSLLQTEEYARVIIESDSLVSPVLVEQRVQACIKRQESLRGDNPVNLTALLSEAALLQQVGSAEIMKRQLEHLSKIIAECPDNVEVRVLPFAAWPGCVVSAPSLMLMDFESQSMPTIACQESVRPVLITGDPNTVRYLNFSYGRASESSLSREESLAMIHAYARKIDERNLT